jgi:phosphatidylinositol dimannoside acyltransferase
VNHAVATDVPPTANAPASSSPPAKSVREKIASFWLDAMFRAVRSAPWLPKLARPLVVRGTCACSRAIRDATDANARRIFGPDVSPRRVRLYRRGVMANFYDFVCDVGRGVGLSREQLAAQIESAHGRENYDAARALKKGAILVTAHMGSFEGGAAGLLSRETAMHVVFKRDVTRFEQVRSSLRCQLGVIEAPVDDGWTMWLRLREALGRDEVVMMQADRVMPGQKGSKVPLLFGHVMLPNGPVKLALASGAPIVPVFAIRSGAGGGKIRIHVEPHIMAEPSDQEPHPALMQFASVLERYLRDYPEQWLLFHRAFCEDTAS